MRKSDDGQWVEAAQLREFEMYERAVDTVREVIFQVDVQGNWRFLNAAWERLTGYSAESALGSSVLEWFHPDFHEQAFGMMGALSVGNLEECESEVRLRCRDGAGEVWRDVEIVKRPLWDDDGTFIGAAGTMSDISARKLAESERERISQALRENEAELRTLFNEMEELVITLSPEGIYLKIAPTSPHLLYRSAIQLIGREFGEVLPPDKARLFTEIVARVAQTGARETLQYALSIEESEVWFEAALSRLSDGNVLWVARDVTKRHQAELALRQSEEHFRAFMNAATFIAFIKDSDERFVYYNRTLQERFCKDGESWIGKSVFDVFPPSIAQNLHEKDQQILQGDEPVVSYENLPTNNGEEMTLLVFKFPLYDSSSQKLLGSIALDVSEQKRAERALERLSLDLIRSNRELANFAYIASHDLQEPLRMVISYLQILKRDYGGRMSEDADEIIGFAVDGSLRMRDLIDDLLDYARVGWNEDNFEIIEGDSVIDAALANLDVAIRDSEARIDRDSLPAVRGDFSQLTQVWQNMIANSLKFRSSDVPHLQIRSRDANEMWEWSLSDNGIGIAPENHQRIFAPFQRLHSNEQFSGTGIGLAIAQKIAENHGGRIRVESELGQGTKFILTLPKANLRESVEAMNQ